MIDNLYQSIENCKKDNSIMIGFNVFGYEDALQVVRAAEAVNRPILIMTNRDASYEMDIAHWGKLLRSIAETSTVQVSAHLDHCSDLEIIKRAIDAGYTSVMYDGSKLPVEENIKNSKEVVEYAHKKGVFVECELGYVPYSDKTTAKPVLTDLDEIKKFMSEVDADMLAISVGNIHRQTDSNTKIDFEHLEKIQEITDVPLVIHGASGILPEDKAKLKEYNVCKINVGTSIRMAFGNALRKTMEENPNEFDRLKLMKPSKEAVYEKACQMIEAMK